jgi:hypothetical protein
MAKKQRPQRCSICSRRRMCKYFWSAVGQGNGYLVCYECRSGVLKNLLPSEIAAVIKRALIIARVYGLFVPHAINVAKGRYSIPEAKKRGKLRRKVLDGKSVDAFSVGKRVPGSFGSNFK